AHRGRRAEALRDAARRQRLELVRERRARPAVVERGASYSGARARLRLRGRQTGDGGSPVVAGMKRLALLAGLVVLLAACGGKSGGSKTAAAPSGGGQTIQVKETEYKLTPSSFTVAKPGTVAFVAK